MGFFFYNFCSKHTPCEPLKKAHYNSTFVQKNISKVIMEKIVSSSERNDTLIGKCPVQGTAHLAMSLIF